MRGSAWRRRGGRETEQKARQDGVRGGYSFSSRMRRRSWAWAAEQRPATAPKARRWPRRRPRSRTARGSAGISGSFIGLQGERTGYFCPLRLIGLFIIKELVVWKRQKRPKNSPFLTIQP